MIEIVDVVKHQVISALSANQFLSGGLVLGALASIGYKLKTLPIQIKNIILNHYTTYVQLNSDTSGYIVFAEYLQEEKALLRPKSFIYQYQMLVLGVATFYFRSTSGIFFSVAQSEEKTETKDRKFTFSFRFLTKDFEKVKKIFVDIENKHRLKHSTDKIYIHHDCNSGYFAAPTFSQLIFDPQFLQEILDDINKFIKNKEFYDSVGIRYKRCYLLSGLPGSGKSALVAALTKHFERKLVFIDGRTGPDQISRNLHRIDDNNFALIEEVDRTIGAKHKISDIVEKIEGKEKEKSSSGYDQLLNILDGVNSASGVILFMTTNNAEEIDSTFKRPGRIDKEFIFTYATEYQMENIFLKFYNNEFILAKQFARYQHLKFSMAKLQEFLLRSNSAEDAIRLIQNDKQKVINEHI